MKISFFSKRVFKQMASNEQLAKVLGLMAMLRIEEGNPGSAHGYTRASQVLLANSNVPQSELRNVKGIGPKSLAVIQEYLTTGHVAELGDRLPRRGSDEEAARNLFLSLEGVGPVTANWWIKQGYRRLEDLPFNELTRIQKIGVTYHHELIQRIPREEIIELQTWFLYTIKPLFQICGSFRRGLATSGDVDVLVQCNETEWQELKTIPRPDGNPLLTHILSESGKKILAVMQFSPNHLHHRIDFERCTREEYPFAVVYFTGSKSFNIVLRQAAINRGWHLDEKALTSVSGGSVPCIDNEVELITLLLGRYVLPKYR
jgi:DNA polymerase/3'-5' exonuclease PolX